MTTFTKATTDLKRAVAVRDRDGSDEDISVTLVHAREICKEMDKVQATVSRFRTSRESLWRAGYSDAMCRAELDGDCDEDRAWAESTQGRAQAKEGGR